MDPEKIEGQIKEKINEVMNKHKSCHRIQEKLDSAMSIAIEEITEKHEDCILGYNPLNKATDEELSALQVIYSYLEKNNMLFTLSCLKEESTIPIQRTEDNLLDFLGMENEPDKAVAQMSKIGFKPSIEISKSEFKKCKVIFTVDEL